jgi:hypothetical protein
MILAANPLSPFFFLLLIWFSKVIALRPCGLHLGLRAATFGVRSSMKLFRDYGKYDDGMWDNNAKVEIYEPGTPLPPVLS